MDDIQNMKSTLIENIFDGLFQIDQKGRITIWNPGAERITGFIGKDIIGTDFQKNAIVYLNEDGREMPKKDTPLMAALKDGMKREVIIYFKHAEGYRVSTLARILPIVDHENKPLGVLQIFTDNKTIIALHKQNQRVEQTVLFDPLTGIGNRSHIEGKIKFTLEDYRSHGVPFGILFVDIDHFKEFNDTYGHLLGDKVLRFVANSLRQNLRFTDSCGRWGGEEFIALILDTEKERLRSVAEKLRSLVEHSGVAESGKVLRITISIGATLVRPSDSYESLIKRADEMMYKSKKAGRNRVSTDDIE